ncbi:MAG: glycosyltransferase family 1 protein [Candidatus Micrarchaeota archaeon]
MLVDYFIDKPIKTEKDMVGVARFLAETEHRIKKWGFDYNYIYPPQYNSWAAVQFSRYFLFPFFSKKHPHAKIAHLGHHTLGFLLNMPFMKKYRKTVITCYDLVNFQPEYRGSKIKNLVYDFSANSMRKADAVIAVTESIKDELIKKAGVDCKKIHVINLSVDLRKFKPKKVPPSFYKKYRLPENKRIVLYVGTEEPRKNMPTLVEALSKVKSDFVFVKAGRPHWKDGREKLAALIKKYGLEGKTKIIDFIEEGDLASMYNAAAAFIFPCKYPTYGLPPIEAMACGTPTIIASDEFTSAELRRAAVCCHPLDSNAFAAGIDKVLSDRKFSGRLSANGRKYASRYTWDRAAAGIAKVYKKLTQ